MTRDGLSLLVITAAERRRAVSWTRRLRHARPGGPLRRFDRHWVIPDPRGRRVGSGGSTLVAMYHVARRLLREGRDAASLESLFRGVRLLLVHGGGDARRLPAYSATGKLFVPLPRPDDRGDPVSLLDVVLEDLATVRAPDDGGVVIAAGDVYVRLAVDPPHLPPRGVSVVATPGDVDTASRHGVFIIDADGRVERCLQKPPRAELAAAGAIDDAGRVFVDTGVAGLGPDAVAAWLDAAGVTLVERDLRPGDGLLARLLRGETHLDLYADMLPDATHDTGSPWRAGGDVHAVRSEGGVFFHVGTSAEIIERLAPDASPPDLVLQETCAATIKERRGPAVVMSSIVEGALDVGAGGAVLEGCHVAGDVTLTGRNLLVGVPPSIDHVTLAPGLGLVCLPLRGGGWTAVTFGVDDDLKTPADAGGTFAGRPLSTLDDATWAPGDQQTLWTARLWRRGDPREVVRHAFAVAGSGVVAAAPDPLCLADVIDRVDHRRLDAHRERIRRRVRLADPVAALQRHDGLDADTLAADPRDDTEAMDLADHLATLIDETTVPLARARWLTVAGRITSRWPATAPVLASPARGRSPRRAALDAVAEAVARTVPLPDEPAVAAVAPGQGVVVRAPVRVDLAGGWSDTPPICHGLGGTVLNLAIAVDERRPVETRATLIPERVVRLRSDDTAETVELADAVWPPPEPALGGWDVLLRAALALAGLVPSRAKTPFADWLNRVGGGIELAVASNLPRGSGLGTSSVLGAAILVALDGLLGRRRSPPDLIAAVTTLEQMIGAGGGWQDQAGALFPGLKILRTSPGPRQVPEATILSLPPSLADAFAARSVFAFTGTRRVAAGIVGNVVDRYLAREPELLALVDAIKANAERAADAAAAGDLDGLATGVATYWRQKRSIDPAACPPAIGALVEPLEPLLSAWELPGAGGGGFLFAIARDPDAAVEARRRLAGSPGVSVHRLAVDTTGLTVENL